MVEQAAGKAVGGYGFDAVAVKVKGDGVVDVVSAVAVGEFCPGGLGIGGRRRTSLAGTGRQMEAMKSLVFLYLKSKTQEEGYQKYSPKMPDHEKYSPAILWHASYLHLKWESSDIPVLWDQMEY